MKSVVPFKVNNPTGVVVDRSVDPGRAYVWDSGNSRILGIDLATCYGGRPSLLCRNRHRPAFRVRPCGMQWRQWGTGLPVQGPAYGRNLVRHP